MINIKITIFIFLFIACNTQDHDENTVNNDPKMTTIGKIVLEDNDYSYQVDSAGNIIDSFKLKETDSSIYSGFKWFNKSDSLLCEELFENESRGINRANIACIDKKGKHKRILYVSQVEEIASGPQISKNDRYILFILSKYLEPDSLFKKGFVISLDLKVIDLKGKQIAMFDSIGYSPNLSIHESPWLLDETHFLYSLSKTSSIFVGGNKVSSEKSFIPGVYIGNIQTGQKKLLIPDGRFAVCSPVDTSFCYVMHDNTIWHMYLNNKEGKVVYKGDKKEYVSNMHWTPDGKFLYILLYIKEGDNFYEKLIDIKTGQEVPFKGFGLGLSRYTWK